MYAYSITIIIIIFHTVLVTIIMTAFLLKGPDELSHMALPQMTVTFWYYHYHYYHPQHHN